MDKERRNFYVRSFVLAVTNANVIKNFEKLRLNLQVATDERD